MAKRNHEKEYDIRGGKEDIELPIFDLMSIVNATDNFSRNNKLGEGGFGPVHKVRRTKVVELFSFSKIYQLFFLFFRVYC